MNNRDKFKIKAMALQRWKMLMHSFGLFQKIAAFSELIGAICAR